jgi:formyltetrahydrofolate hydrolase
VSANGVLLLSCADRPGIVSAVAGFLAEHGGNIVDAQQHTDPVDRVFFQRVEFELDGCDLSREQIDPALAPLAERFGLDRAVRFTLVVLARYMQVLSAEFCAGWPARIINIHHSFLPAFVGGRPYHQAHDRGVKIIGVTAHYVTADLDEGPIIDQDVARVSHRNGVEELQRRGRDLEVVVLARAVRAHTEHRVLVHNHRTLVFD